MSDRIAELIPDHADAVKDARRKAFERGKARGLDRGQEETLAGLRSLQEVAVKKAVALIPPPPPSPPPGPDPLILVTKAIQSNETLLRELIEAIPVQVAKMIPEPKPSVPKQITREIIRDTDGLVARVIETEEPAT